MESLFKVGDVVTIKGQYDEGMRSSDYPLGFLCDEMLLRYGNKKCIIATVDKLAQHHKDRIMYNNDPFVYTIIGNNWLWHSSMFVEGNNIKSKAINIF